MRKFKTKWIALPLASLGIWILSGCNSDSSSSPTTVAGTVTDELGTPIEGANVTLAQRSSASVVPDTSGGSGTAVTDASGNYQVAAADASADVVVQKPGFREWREQMPRIGPGRHHNVEVQRDGKTPFADMDANTDGSISVDEWKGPPEGFQAADADGSGSVTSAELDTFIQSRRRALPDRGPMDANGDGVISRDEWFGPPEVFTRVDANADGKVTKEELQADRGFLRGRPMPMPAGAGGTPGGATM